MIVYIVVCNGKISSDGYKTLQEAQKFCETRSGNPEKTDNGWRYRTENDLYQIQDIKIEDVKTNDDFDFILTEEDARNYKIQTNLRQDKMWEKFIKSFIE